MKKYTIILESTTGMLTALHLADYLNNPPLLLSPGLYNKWHETIAAEAEKQGLVVLEPIKGELIKPSKILLPERGVIPSHYKSKHQRRKR